MSFHTPLRYPGGKARLGPWLAYTLRQNEISGGTYAEPYAGGAGAAIYLLINGYVSRLLLNDLDPCVHAFWHSVLHDTEALVRLIENAPLTIAHWKHQKKVLDDRDATTLERGFACFFLNRSNRSGILRGGVIGGLEQTGPYNLDARFNKRDLIGRIERIADKAGQIKLYGLDAAKFLRTQCANLGPRSLIYLDPPYFEKGPELYRNFYEPEDHAAIARQVLALKTPWLVTYDCVAEIRTLYAKAQGSEFSLTYSTHLARTKASELLFYGNLSLPLEPVLCRSPNTYPRAWDRRPSLRVA